ncbi:hypothetical protein ADIARSV_0662 [Arcticibacter svalbardensis MN12-7]|uniref:DinB-like domain-containing protein n=1 Tax=Arcticibacter svalbardensis MN12-7 TaxID=1150600 RepID=R9H4S6_9SPHI|nr:DinB family protein [Arcticibacter svalbardensis]EOR96149.1 hypothetical protein ADIARSV_0662 [Arcticibacter svalbardensis MN12-7]
MKITELIAQNIIDVQEGDNWTEVNIKTTVQDISVEEANSTTAASTNTIATLLHHLTYWNRVMVQRMNGIDVVVPDTNGFDMSAIQTEKEWDLLKEDNVHSAHELATAIIGLDETLLTSPILPGYSSAYKHLQGSCEHIHYHLGQMVILKQLVRATMRSRLDPFA